MCYGESHHIISVVPRGLRCGTGMGETECELTVPAGTTIHLSVTGSAATCALRECVIEPAVDSDSCSEILMERDETYSLGGCLRD
jgi:hypothetical protein